MVGEALIADDGDYRIEVPDAPRTFSRYVVTVPAVSGNLAGTSALQTVQASAEHARRRLGAPERRARCHRHQARWPAG